MKGSLGTLLLAVIAGPLLPMPGAAEAHKPFVLMLLDRGEDEICETDKKGQTRCQEQPDTMIPLACSEAGQKKILLGTACLKGVPTRTRVRLADGSFRTTTGKLPNTALCHTYRDSAARSSVLLLSGPRVAPRGEGLAIWPADADMAAFAGTPRLLKPDEASEVMKHLSGFAGPTRVSVVERDLDADGKPELIYIVQAASSGRSMILVAPSGRLDKLEKVPPQNPSASLVLDQTLLGTIDLGEREGSALIVLERSCNEYGVFILSYGAFKRLFSFDCGNC